MSQVISVAPLPRLPPSFDPSEVTVNGSILTMLLSVHALNLNLDRATELYKYLYRAQWIELRYISEPVGFFSVSKLSFGPLTAVRRQMLTDICSEDNAHNTNGGN